jgi:flagellar biosynthesis anti-sigma factor FlgM
MLDKIQSNLPAGYTQPVNRTGSQTPAPHASSRPLGGPAAEVSLSSEAVTLQKALKAAQEGPDIRADIVQAIQDQLKAGTYRVDANSLADKLMPFMK